MKYLITISIIFCLNIGASVPTPEGLFRNGNNKEPSGDTIIYDFMIEEMSMYLADSGVSMGSIDGEMSKEDLEEKKKKSYFKIYFQVADNSFGEVLQIKYNKQSMAYKDIESSKIIKSLDKEIENDQSVERKIFYSMINMLLKNDSKLFSTVLEKMSPLYLTNQKLLNKKKVDLYGNYKSYLIATREDETLKAEMKSPLEPEEVEQKEIVSETLKEPMYLKNELVSLEKIDDRFFWKINLESIKFLFTNENHRFAQMDMETSLGKINIRAGNYVLFDGIHELPKEIIFKSLNGKLYRLKSLSLRHMNGTKSMSERKKMFDEKVAEVKSKVTKDDSSEESEDDSSVMIVPMIY